MKLTIKDGAYEELQNTNHADILSVKETQKILGICRISVYHLIETQQLKSFRIGRVYMIPKRAVARFLTNQEGGVKKV